MVELLAKYLTVLLSSTIKFVGGPIAGLAIGLSYVETALFTALGMMTTVLVFTLLGNSLRQFLQRTIWKNKKRFTRRNRRFVYIWKRWGLLGVSFLTPLILTPVGGALLANIFGGPKKQIIMYMMASAFFWGFAISGIFFSVKGLVM
jgi:uncharacterized membrane protein